MVSHFQGEPLLSRERMLIMMRFRSNKLLLSSTLLVGLVAATSFATPSLAEIDPQQACASDVMRLCQQFIPDHGRIAACLSRNKRQLSPACHSVMSTPKKKQRHAAR
jgi:hypothetical protein